MGKVAGTQASEKWVLFGQRCCPLAERTQTPTEPQMVPMSQRVLRDAGSAMLGKPLIKVALTRGMAAKCCQEHKADLKGISSPLVWPPSLLWRPLLAEPVLAPAQSPSITKRSVGSWIWS